MFQIFEIVLKLDKSIKPQTTLQYSSKHKLPLINIRVAFLVGHHIRMRVNRLSDILTVDHILEVELDDEVAAFSGL